MSSQYIVIDKRRALSFVYWAVVITLFALGFTAAFFDTFDARLPMPENPLAMSAWMWGVIWYTLVHASIFLKILYMILTFKILTIFVRGTVNDP